MGIFVVTFLHRSVFTQILGGPLPYENLPMMSEAVGAGSQKIVMSEDVFGFVFDCPGIRYIFLILFGCLLVVLFGEDVVLEELNLLSSDCQLTAF